MSATASQSSLRLPRYVEVETSRLRARAGRRIAPNPARSAGSVADGRRQDLMAWPLFDKIVRELGDLDYAGWLAFHHCSEPLLNPRLVREVEHVRSLVPRARPAIHTSGDLLTPSLLVDLLQLGAGYVRITRYPRHPEAEPDYETVRRWLLEGGLLDSLPWRFVEMRHGWAAVYERNGLRVDVIRPRLAARRPEGPSAPGETDAAAGAGEVEEARPLPESVSGSVPVPEPVAGPAAVAIDCTGQVARCRTVFGDVSACGHHTIGNLRERTFADLWSSPTLTAHHDADAGDAWSSWPTTGICTERFAVPSP